MVESYIVTSDQQSAEDAAKFAKKHNLKLCKPEMQKDKINIEFIDKKLFVSFYENRQKLSFEIGFSDIKLQARSQKAKVKETIIKAVGEIEPDYKLYDLTAGFAKDSFILANYGYDVTLLEKHPIIYALTKYSIDQLAGSKLGERMKIINQDSLEFLERIPKGKNVFYLDPMFVRTKKSKVKKEMQLLQKINPPELNIELLLEKALEKGEKVILKRQITDPSLSNYTSHHIIKGSKIKFEIYTVK